MGSRTIILWKGNLLASHVAEEQYQKVSNKNELKEGNLLKVEVKGKQIVLSMVEEKIYAIDEICTHDGGPLDEGELS